MEHVNQNAIGNADVEIWRKNLDDYHSTSIHVTEEGKIGININGRVVLAWPEEWWSLGVEYVCLRMSKEEKIREIEAIQLDQWIEDTLREMPLSDVTVDAMLKVHPEWKMPEDSKAKLLEEMNKAMEERREMLRKEGRLSGWRVLKRRY